MTSGQIWSVLTIYFSTFRVGSQRLISVNLPHEWRGRKTGGQNTQTQQAGQPWQLNYICHQYFLRIGNIVLCCLYPCRGLVAFKPPFCLHKILVVFCNRHFFMQYCGKNITTLLQILKALYGREGNKIWKSLMINYQGPDSLTPDPNLVNQGEVRAAMASVICLSLILKLGLVNIGIYPRDPYCIQTSWLACFV